MSRRSPLIAIWVLAAAYVAGFTLLSWWKYETFHSTTYDLAIYSRKLWGICHGEFRIPLIDNALIWADHLEPILLLLAPLTLLWHPVFVLLLAQSVAIGATSIILFYAARSRVNEWVAFLIAAAVLIHPSVQNAALFEFHGLTLALPFLAVFLANFDRRPTVAFWALIGGLACREEVAGILFLWGAMQFKKSRPRCVTACVVALCWVALCVKLKESGFSSDHFHKLWAVDDAKMSADFWKQRFETTLILFGSFAFLPLFGRKTLLWAVLPAVSTVMERPGVVEIEFHYLSFFVPFLAFAAIEAFTDRRWALPKAVALLVCVTTAMWWYTVAPWGAQSSMKLFKPDRYAEEAEKILKLIGPDDSVSAPARFLGHVADRKWPILAAFAGTDSLVAEMKPQRVFLASEAEHRKNLESIAARYNSLVANLGYRLTFEGVELRLYQKPKK